MAAGYIVAFLVADNGAASWFVAAIAVAGSLAATAGIAALPGTLRVVLGAVATAFLVVLRVLGVPVSVGLLIGALLIGGGTMALYETRQDKR